MTDPGFPRLAELQTLFWRLVSAPEGVRAGATDLVREAVLASEDLSFLVAPDARLDPVGRLDVYADMYFYRLRDCLAEDYPKLAAWLGEEHWHNLVTDYLLAHPSRHFSLRELGRALPGFLEAHALAGSFAGLADLARLEWARVDVFDETDATPVSRDDLVDQGVEAARLALIPGARLLRLHPTVLPLWKRLEEGSEPEAADPRVPAEPCVAVLVWRQAFGVRHRSLAPDEERCLLAIATRGATLAEVGEALLDEPQAAVEPEPAAQRLAELVGRWTRDELLTRHAQER